MHGSSGVSAANATEPIAAGRLRHCGAGALEGLIGAVGKAPQAAAGGLSESRGAGVGRLFCSTRSRSAKLAPARESPSLTDGCARKCPYYNKRSKESRECHEYRCDADQ